MSLRFEVVHLWLQEPVKYHRHKTKSTPGSQVPSLSTTGKRASDTRVLESTPSTAQVDRRAGLRAVYLIENEQLNIDKAFRVGKFLVIKSKMFPLRGIRMHSNSLKWSPVDDVPPSMETKVCQVAFLKPPTMGINFPVEKKIRLSRTGCAFR